MHTVWLLIEFALVGYILWDAKHAVSRYGELKRAIADGDGSARERMYRDILLFEGISAALALGALGFDFGELTPQHLGLSDSPALQWLSGNPEFVHGQLVGILVSVSLGTSGWIAVRLFRRAPAEEPAARIAQSARSWLPDFSALVPVTMRERLLFVAVAVSAGVCEEVVFRGWLLDALHGQLGVHGVGLIGAGAVVFGLAHAYQRSVGMLVTGVVGALLSVLYVATGSLLVPMLLHVFIDARIALLPTSRTHRAQALPA